MPQSLGILFLSYLIVISRSKLRDRDWSNSRHDVQKYTMLPGFISAASGNMDYVIHVPGNMAHHAFASTFWFDCSFRQINTYSLLLRHGWSLGIKGKNWFCFAFFWCGNYLIDTNLLHLFRDITKQILTLSLDQHWKIMPFSHATLPMLPSGLWLSGNIAQLRGIIFQCCPRHQLISVYCYYTANSYRNIEFHSPCSVSHQKAAKFIFIGRKWSQIKKPITHNKNQKNKI